MLMLSEHAVKYPKKHMWMAALASLVLIVLVAVPTLVIKDMPYLNPLSIDTDPENMLDADEPVRVYHNQMKKEFSLYDIVVVGIVNKTHEQGVFNVDSLKKIYELTKYAQNLQWKNDKGENVGVIGIDVLAPSNVDNIQQAGLGSVTFEWLMDKPPATDEEALEIAEKAQRIPFLDDTLISKDRKAMALYLPITSKDISYDVAKLLKEKIASFDKGDEEWHITGMPVAQDQFGVEMFVQMAVSAPMAMLLIFALMWYFFRNVKLIISPMIVAMVSVILTMGLLVVTGHTVHIMSSMIPIFIMPIAVLDAVHILSDFFDRYQKMKDRKKTIKHVMEELSRPMLFTTLTTCAGFGSLAFTPIPPVQVFGIFVALGVFFAWIFTITLVPAYIMLMKEESLEGFGMAHEDGRETSSPLAKTLFATGRFTYNWPKLILLGTLLLGCVAAYGMTLIKINDNPVKWFEESHEIRVADKALNNRFGGTYMGYLVLTPKVQEFDMASYSKALREKLKQSGNPFAAELGHELDTLAKTKSSKEDLLESAKEIAEERSDAAESDDAWEAWDALALALDSELQSSDVFKDPATLRFIEKLQAHLVDSGLVGKSNALPDIVKTVHRDLFMGEDKAYRIPDSAPAVAQTLMTYQNSHRPQDLWHFVTPDYRTTNLWIQMKSGDNIDMNKVIDVVDAFMAENDAPIALEHKWFGLTYINVVWQDKMTTGMVEAFLGSFVIVLILMTFLFRSLWWGLLCMVPLTITIAFIYGMIGLVGKDYDMPVAVLSSLSLGLAVDYSIHFLARAREMRKDYGTWKETVSAVFGEPGRAIARNVIVIGVGFLPLLAAPLVPYQTVGFLISSILVLAGVATLILLPALMTLFQKLLFKG